MFNFKEINYLFKNKYNNLSEIISPRKLGTTINKQEYLDILSGIILNIISHVMLIILSFIVSHILVNKNIGTNITGLKITISFFTFIPLIIPIIIIIYYTYKYINKSYLNNNLISITYIFISMFVSIISIITWISTIKYNLSCGIVGIISLIILFIGDLFILKGLLDISYSIYNIYLDSKKDNIKHPNIKVSSININDVSEHDFKICKYCGNREIITATKCSKCGNMI